MKSQKEGGSGPPRAVTPWKKKKRLHHRKHSVTKTHTLIMFGEVLIVYCDII
jgi:hypothetical protein